MKDRELAGSSVSLIGADGEWIIRASSSGNCRFAAHRAA
jgi:hypothetical protein